MGNIPLYLFFEQLQKNKFALGIAAYQQLLHAMQGGFGLDNQEALFQLCKTFWYKPHHDFEVFKDLFDTYFKQEQQEATQLIERERTAQTSGSNLPKRETTDLDEPIDNPIEETPFELEKDKKELPKEDNEPKIEENTGLDETEYTTIQLSIGHQTSDNVLHAESSKSPDDFTFTFDKEQLPFSKQKLLRHWRAIQTTKSFKGYKTLDIERTIASISKQGKYLQPIFSQLQKRLKPTYLLMDKGGSMAAFDAMITEFSRVLKKYFSDTTLFYFYNLPQEYLFQNITYTEGITQNNFYKQCKAEQPNIIILSDAGAARGRYNEERIKATTTFLTKIKQSGSTMVWLNPMPENRWKYNSALAIAAYTSMYELNLAAIQQAVRYIRNKN